MKLLRNLIDDLVEKRLWPVALLLVAALVAVPVLLAKKAAAPSSPSGLALSVPKVAALASAVPAVDLVTPDETKRLDHLAKHNPFVQLHLPKVAKVPKTTPATTPSTGSGTGTGTGTGGAAPGTTTTTTTTTTTAPSFTLSSLDLRFGKIDAKRERRNLPRLAPLPSSGNPLLIYMGLLKDTHTAVFLIATGAHAEGDGKCLPHPSDCQILHMNAGDTEFFDVTRASGAVSQYELDLLHVRLTTTHSAGVAKAAYARASSNGRDQLRKFLSSHKAPAVGSLRYDSRAGHLVTFTSPKASWGHLRSGAFGSPRLP